MPESISERDPALEDLRRKARRRLVGAVVLALAALVILPMLLEKEPSPLGDDVAVRIPPVDDGKFVNRLNTPASPIPPEAAVQPAPNPPAAKASGPIVTVPPSAPPAEATAPAPPATPLPPAPAIPAKAAPAAPAATAAPLPAGAPAAKPPADGFVVQLAAFSDDKGANALGAKLKRNGYPAFTEPVVTARGTLYRVRVGPYPSRDAAADARAKLKGEGYSGIVAPTR